MGNNDWGDVCTYSSHANVRDSAPSAISHQPSAIIRRTDSEAKTQSDSLSTTYLMCIYIGTVLKLTNTHHKVMHVYYCTFSHFRYILSHVY